MSARRHASILILVALGLTLGSQPASAAFLPAGSTAVLSGTPSLTDALPAPVGRARLTADAVSGDGGAVAFSSESDGLLAVDDDGVENVYVKVRRTGAVVLVSRRTGVAGEPAHADCAAAAISDDGNRVAFACDGPLDPADTNEETDVYVRDLTLDQTILVSRAAGEGPVGGNGSFDPAIDEDGSHIAFSSTAQNLDPAAPGGGVAVYRRDVVNGSTELVSRSPAGPMRGEEPSINADGSRVAFTSTDSIAGDSNGVRDVYLRDISDSRLALVSRGDGDGAVGNRASYAPSIDAAGSAVAFESQASNFDAAADPDASPDVYRRGLTAKATRLVSETAAGDGGQLSQAPSIDRSGMKIAFRSNGDKLHPDDRDRGADAYHKDLATNELQVVSRAPGPLGRVSNAVGLGAVAISGGGGHVAFALDDGRIMRDVDPVEPTVALRDVIGGATTAIARPAGADPFRNQGGAATAAALSNDGRFSAFVSTAPGLGLPSAATAGVFVRDRVTGGVVLASRADGLDGAPIVPDDRSPAISADGRRVAWAVTAGSDRGIWVRDLPSGRTMLASRADGPAGAPGNGSSFDPALDADGDRVAFVSRATNLGDGDTDAEGDVHLRDLASGRTLLASSSAGGQKANELSFDPDIDAGGTRVAFRSYATNLGDGDTDTLIDVHRKDLSSGAIRLVSATPGGTKGDGSALSVSIDASGNRVAFATFATNLGGAGTAAKVFVRDLAAESLVLASRADGPDGAPATEEANDAVLSPDGGSVGFGSDAPGLVPGAPGDAYRVYVRDLASGRTTLVSRRNGTDEPVGQSTLGDLSDEGGCVAFTSPETAAGTRVDGSQAYLRVLGDNCRRGVTGGQAGGGAGGAGGGRSNGGAGPSGGGVARPDRTAPVLSRVSLRPARLRITRGRAAARRPSVLSFTTSEAGRVSVRVERLLPGRKLRGTCRPVTRRVRRGACTARRDAGTLRTNAKRGTNRVRLTGRIGKRSLPAGTYRLTLTVRDAAGNPSMPITRRLTVVRGRAR